MFWRARHYLSSMFSRPPSFPPSSQNHLPMTPFVSAHQADCAASLVAVAWYLHGNGRWSDGVFFFLIIFICPIPRCPLSSRQMIFVQRLKCVYKKTFHPAAVVAQIPLFPSPCSNYAALRILSCSINLFSGKKKKKKKKVRAQNPISAGAMRKHAVPAQ